MIKLVVQALKKPAIPATEMGKWVDVFMGLEIVGCLLVLKHLYVES